MLGIAEVTGIGDATGRMEETLEEAEGALEETPEAAG